MNTYKTLIAITSLVLSHFAAIAAFNKKDNALQSSLFNAVAYCDSRGVSKSIQEGADIEARDEYNLTPLFNAAANASVSDNCRSVTQLLINAGANKEVRNNDGLTPLLWLMVELVYTHAIEKKNANSPEYARFMRIIELLVINGADVTAEYNGHNSVFYANYLNNEELISLLLKHLYIETTHLTDFEVKIPDTSRNLTSSYY